MWHNARVPSPGLLNNRRPSGSCAMLLRPRWSCDCRVQDGTRHPSSARPACFARDKLPSSAGSVCCAEANHRAVLCSRSWCKLGSAAAIRYGATRYCHGTSRRSAVGMSPCSRNVCTFDPRRLSDTIRTSGPRRAQRWKSPKPWVTKPGQSQPNACTHRRAQCSDQPRKSSKLERDAHLRRQLRQAVKVCCRPTARRARARHRSLIAIAS